MIFTKNQIHCLCSSQEELSLLDVVKKHAKDAIDIDMKLYMKSKSDSDCYAIDFFLGSLLMHAVVGHTDNDVVERGLSKSWYAKLRSKDVQQDKEFELVDITEGLSYLFALKDSDELEKVKKAASFSTEVMNKFVIPELRSVIKGEQKVKHSILSKKTEKAILQPSKTYLEDETLLRHVDEFDFATFLIDPDALQSKAYAVLRKAHEAAIAELRPGNRVAAAYKAACFVVEGEAPALVDNLTTNAGSGIGLEFQESGWILDEKDDNVVEENMVFNVSLGFQGLQSNSSKNFSLYLADTVIVTHANPEIVTAGYETGCSISDDAEETHANIGSFFSDDAEEEREMQRSPRTRGELIDWAKSVIVTVSRGGFKSLAKSEELREKFFKATEFLLVGDGIGVLSPAKRCQLETFVGKVVTCLKARRVVDENTKLDSLFDRPMDRRAKWHEIVGYIDKKMEEVKTKRLKLMKNKQGDRDIDRLQEELVDIERKISEKKDQERVILMDSGF